MSESHLLRTARLDLIGADTRSLTADLDGASALARAVDAVVPDEWPPEHYDADAVRWMLEALKSVPGDSAWRSYYIALRNPANATRTLIGTCGFKGVPDGLGCIELGYSVLPDHQRKGYASEAVLGLIDLARRHGARKVAAETYPDLVASIRVMEKCGLRFLGPGSEPGTIRYVCDT
ncbi:MAG TPA: GNAT family N-acetyltransferase [Usitatibacteraceae bacterium]|nr:GNAT family N-acetyltransferase [Usitatibacteraceae bacterium]